MKKKKSVESAVQKSISNKRKSTDVSDPVSSKKSKSGPTVSSATATVSSECEFGSSIVKNANGVYACSVCDIEFKFKRNVKPHLKSKRHVQATKDAVAVTDERVSGSDNLEEIGFARQKEGEEGKSRPGTSFLVEVNRPVKYKIARRLMKTVSSCATCMKPFRDPAILSRHQRTPLHKRNVKKEKARRRLRAKLVAGGPPNTWRHFGRHL